MVMIISGQGGTTAEKLTDYSMEKLNGSSG